MPPSRYRVVSSDKAREELRTVLAQAEAEGRRESVVAVVRKVFEGLTWIPEEVGESTEDLPSIGTVKRHVLQAPITIEFAINEEHRVVFILRVYLWPLKKEG
jgi:hypothetical protein